MDSLDDSKISKMGFFKYVFNFDDDSKSELLNISQYSLIALIPIVILNKVMQKFVPEADEEKGSLELLAEIILQIIVMFVGILFINRIVTYVPTYSGMKYPEFSVIYIILAVLVITLSLQTKLGEKVSIIVDRISDLWEGTDKKKKKKKASGQVKVSQPISGQQMQQADNAAMGNSLFSGGGGTTSISQLPTEQQQDHNYGQQQQQQQEQFQGNTIMAANEALGGSAFGSNF